MLFSGGMDLKNHYILLYWYKINILTISHTKTTRTKDLQ